MYTPRCEHWLQFTFQFRVERITQNTGHTGPFLQYLIHLCLSDT